LLRAAHAPADVVRPESLVDQLLARVAGVGDVGLHAPILECALNHGRGSMGNRRAFLRLAAAGAMWPSLAWSQKAPKKPEGILVNDVHGQLSATLVYRIVQPDTLDGVRAA